MGTWGLLDHSLLRCVVIILILIIIIIHCSLVAGVVEGNTGQNDHGCDGETQRDNRNPEEMPGLA